KYGTVGLTPATSGRAPSTSTASPMNTRSFPSPVTGSRMTRTRVTPISSSVQPDTAIDPATPVAPSSGVSTAPVGGVPVFARTVLSPTDSGPAVPTAPVSVNVTVPLYLPFGRSPAANFTPTVRIAEPVPDAGVTVIQGWLAVAVQLTLPTPFCESRTS